MPDQHHITPETAAAVRRWASEALCLRRAPGAPAPTQVQIALMSAALLGRLAPLAPIEAPLPPNLRVACDPTGVLAEHEVGAAEAVYCGERAIAREGLRRPRAGPPRAPAARPRPGLVP